MKNKHIDDLIRYFVYIVSSFFYLNFLLFFVFYNSDYYFKYDVQFIIVEFTFEQGSKN